VGQHGNASGSILLDLAGFEVLGAELAGGEWLNRPGIPGGSDS
jgi:hypothetical protein